MRFFGLPLLRPIIELVFLMMLLLARDRFVVIVRTRPATKTYFSGARFVHLMLGPPEIVLAVPLYHAGSALPGAIVPMLAAVIAGSFTAVVSVVLLA
ncbi:LrgB family protein [Bradyrhizobium sp. CIR3A]|uniref:LrgB family protein n=1 Tax=Bradyrhizobium sp. CIR3A TaxID=2663838 RepID=UPI0018356BDD|nr:putative effector of murein hydrolase [Bradyrhizobium sp. CIR3A]